MAQEKYLDCIEACNRCANECTYCASACLQEEDVTMMARCIALDRDCAALCRTTSMLLSADSEFSAEVCRLCAEVCRACGEECRRHDLDHCQDCADQCERCAEECDRMAESAREIATTRSRGKAGGKIQRAGSRAASTMTTNRSVRPADSSLRRRQTVKKPDRLMPQNKKNRSKASTSLNQQRETEERSKKVRMEQIPGGVSVKRGRGFGADPHYTKP